MKQFSKDLGNVSLAPKGKWSREQDYERLALVYNACDNLSYVAKIDVPSGVDIENREYWQPMNATGYADNNFINLTTENENGTITAYESIEEAVATILPINRRAGATLSFYNLNSDRLDRQAEFELWQFNSTDLANWENRDYWNNIYYNWNVFAGWYVGADALKNHVKIPTIGQYAYVGSNLNDAILYQCRTNGVWTNTGIKVRNYISVVVSGNITIGENGNWFSNGEDTGIPATPAVDEQLDNIIMQLQQHATEIDELQKQDVVLKSNIDSNFETINNKVDNIKTATDNKIDTADTNLQNQITSNDTDIATLNTKHESLSRTVQGIAVTGGANTATNVTYNNDSSGLNAENVQDAIDEVGSKVSELSKNTEIVNEENVPIKTPMSYISDIKDRLDIETDSEGRVLAYRDKDGIKHEVVGLDIPILNGHKVEELLAKKIARDNTIYVAAFDSSVEDKNIADYICDSQNDEIEINRAIKDCGSCGTVYLFAGNYYVDKFYPHDGFAKSAIVVTEDGAGGKTKTRSVTIKGFRHYYYGTNIHVREKAFDGIAEDEQPCVFNVLSYVNISGSGYEAYWYISLQDLFISLPNWNRNAIIVNLTNAGCGEEKNLRLSAFGDNQDPEYTPKNFDTNTTADKLVGITGFHGWTYGDCVRMDNICVWGCRVAFQLGGEHLICNNLRARKNYCGYTFGEYYKSLGRDLNSYGYGVFDHPITLINCCDEHSIQGPVFAWCGKMTNYYKDGDKKLQEINFIDFNTEAFKKLAYEKEPGTFCGNIYYHPSNGVHGGFVNLPFWEDGCGKNFRTVNLTHPEGGTSDLRKKMYGNYMQRYFDTDLNKELICINPPSQKWVDVNGNIISKKDNVSVNINAKDEQNVKVTENIRFISVTENKEYTHTSSDSSPIISLPIDTYSIELDNYIYKEKKIKVTKNITLDLQLTRAFKVSGVVNKNLYDMYLVFSDANGEDYAVKTDANNGSFSILLPNGNYTISTHDYPNLSLSQINVSDNSINIEDIITNV